MRNPEPLANFLQVGSTHELHEMSVEFELLFGQNLLGFLADLAEKLLAHTLNRATMDLLRYLAQLGVIDTNGDELSIVDVLNGPGQAGHVRKVPIVLAVVFGHRTRYDTNAVALFPAI